MSKSTEYRCDAEVIELLERKNLSLAALRIVHACCYIVDQDIHYSLTNMAVKKDCTFKMLCTTLSQITCCHGANDNRSIAEGVIALQGAGLFDII